MSSPGLLTPPSGFQSTLHQVKESGPGSTVGDCSGYKQLTGPSCLINNSDPVELAHFTLSQLNCVDPTHLSQAIIQVYSKWGY